MESSGKLSMWFDRQFVLRVALGALICAPILPNLAHAQAIAGTVSDTTGAVLPGVTVEVRSPALIEQVRSNVTDGTGQYNIVALEPGTYAVTFTLPGFSTLVREGVVLTTGFTANVDAQLSVGTLEETVTVTQASPTIDVRSIRQAESIDRELIEVLPSTRSHDTLAMLVPAINNQAGVKSPFAVDTGGIGGEANKRASIHGSDISDAVIAVDGMDSNQVAMEGSPQGTPHDTAVQEYVFEYSGNSAEVETGGVHLNMIPKEGSNTFSGGFYSTFAHSDWLANNIDQELIDRGITGGEEGGTKLDQSWIVAPSIGGPIVRDRLWFFTSYSRRRGSFFPPNLFNNTDTSGLAYVPDLDAPTRDRTDMYEGTLRLTWQATSKDKVQAYWSNNHTNQTPSLTGSQLDPFYIAPESGSELITAVNTYQASWVRPQTNRVLFEAGISWQPNHTPLIPLDAETQLARGHENIFDARTDLPGVLDFLTLTLSRNMGPFFNGTEVWFSTKNRTLRGSMSYVTGSHNLKVGIQHNQKWQNEAYRSNNNWTNMVTFGGFPVTALFSARPNETNEVMSVGIYAQDQWTIDRFTVNAGVRFDYQKAFYPDQVTEPMTWSPIPRAFPGMDVARWKDLQPRLGVVYDLRGDGRTALKASASRYGDRGDIALAGEINPVANNISMARVWNDGLTGCVSGTCTPGDGLVQGDPLNFAPNGELLSPNPSPGFATPQVTTFFDPDYAFGWFKKHANWEFSGSVQHELVTGLSLDVGYFRRHFVNLNVVQDRSNVASDWDEWTYIVPEDPRIPGGGGYPLTFVDLNPAGIAVPDEITTNADDFGGRSHTWHGVDINFSVRLEGLLLQGGYATGKETKDDCAVNAVLPERINLGSGTESVTPLEHCHTETPWIHQATVYGSYTFPYDIIFSGTFLTREGTERLTIIGIPGSVAAEALGRQPTQTTISANVVPPGTQYGDRLNQFDIRFAKLFDFATSNVRASLDIHNLFNENAVSRERYTLLQTYLQPVGVQPGRLMRLTMQYNF